MRYLKFSSAVLVLLCGIKGFPHVFVFKHLENFLLNTLLTSTFTTFICKSMFLARKQPKGYYVLYRNGGQQSFLIHLSSGHGKLCYFAEMQHDVMGTYAMLGHRSCYFVVPCTLYDKAKTPLLC